MRLLACVALAVSLLAGRADADPVPPLRQFFAAVLSEPGPLWARNDLCRGAGAPWDCCSGPRAGKCRPIKYSAVFSDNRGWEQEEGRVFDVVGADGRLCHLQVSQKGGTLDRGDAGAVVTLRRCAAGAATCTWQDTPLALTIASDDGGRDVRWTEPGCVEVSAGDAVALEWDLSANASTMWGGAHDEAPEAYVEFLSGDATHGFLASNAVQGTSFQNLYCWSLAGGNEGTNTDPGAVQIPVPGEFTLDGIFVRFAAPAGADTSVHLCQGSAAGGDAGCGGASAGTTRMSCRVPAGGTTCSSQKCIGGEARCALAPGDRLYACTRRNDVGNLRALSARLASPRGQWFSAASVGGVGPVEIEYSRRGPNSVIMCNDWVTEDPQCMVPLPRAWTALAMFGWMAAPLTAGALDVSPRIDGRDAPLHVTFTPTEPRPSASLRVPFRAGSYFNLQSSPRDPRGGGAYGVSILWESAP